MNDLLKTLPRQSGTLRTKCQWNALDCTRENPALCLSKQRNALAHQKVQSFKDPGRLGEMFTPWSGLWPYLSVELLAHLCPSPQVDFFFLFTWHRETSAFTRVFFLSFLSFLSLIRFLSRMRFLSSVQAMFQCRGNKPQDVSPITHSGDG